MENGERVRPNVLLPETIEADYRRNIRSSGFCSTNFHAVLDSRNSATHLSAACVELVQPFETSPQAE
jgi:hypothetical protein